MLDSPPSVRPGEAKWEADLGSGARGAEDLAGPVALEPRGRPGREKASEDWLLDLEQMLPIFLWVI